MKEVLQKSDFAIKVSFFDATGKSLQLKKFKFAYSTHLSTPVEAEFDGQNYSPNCRPLADGIEVIFDNPRFNVGQMTVHRQYSIQSAMFPGEEKDFTQTKTLPITIVQSHSQTTDNKVIPLVENTSNSDIVFVETVLLEAIKGDKGDKGDDGLYAVDYSSTNEQLLVGQVFVGKSGTQKQLYGRRVRVSGKISLHENQTFVFVAFRNLFYIDAVADVIGYISINDGVGTNNYKFASTDRYTSIFSPSGGDESYYANDMLQILWESMDPNFKEMVGKSVTYDLFVKYTKL